MDEGQFGDYATRFARAVRTDLPDDRMRSYIASGAKSIAPGQVSAPFSRNTRENIFSSHNGSKPSPSGPWDSRGPRSAMPLVPSAKETSILYSGRILNLTMDQTAIAITPKVEWER